MVPELTSPRYEDCAAKNLTGFLDLKVVYTLVMLIAGIVALVVWAAFRAYSEERLKKIPIEFKMHDQTQKKNDIKSYKRHLRFLKFSKFMLDKLPYIAMAIIIIIVSGPFGVFIVLGVLWFKSSLRDTNYRGYRTQKNAQKRYAKELDEWLIIANQAI